MAPWYAQCGVLPVLLGKRKGRGKVFFFSFFAEEWQLSQTWFCIKLEQGETFSPTTSPNITNSLPIHLPCWLKQLTSLCHFSQMFPKLSDTAQEASACDFVTFASPYVTNMTLPSKPKYCWQKSKECSRLLGNRRDPLKHPQCSMSFHIFYVLL